MYEYQSHPEVEPIAGSAHEFWYNLRGHVGNMMAILREGERLSVTYEPPQGPPMEVFKLGFQDPNMIILHGDREYIVMHMSGVRLHVKAVPIEQGKAQSPEFMNDPSEYTTKKLTPPS